jgi:hypothetical protein
MGALAASVLFAAGLGVATAPAASAAPCVYSADLPARVSIDRPSVQIAVPLRGCEGWFDWASATVYGPAGNVGFLYWNAGRTEYWTAYDWRVTPGVYNTNDGDGYTSDLQPAAWQGDTTTVKFATRSGVSATRSGSQVTVNALATRYDAGSSKFIPFGNRVIAIEHCLTQTSGCSVLAYAKTNSAGRATITVNAPALRSYRVTYGESGSFWGATSTRVRA